jgi:hypothetical protein
MKTGFSQEQAESAEKNQVNVPLLPPRPPVQLRFVAWLLLLAALRGWAAAGDIISAAVETNGWVCRIEVALGTNSQFFNGFGANNTLTATNNLRLDLVSMGFDDAGNGIQVARSVYGTKLMRRPYPDYLIQDCMTNDGGGIVTLRIALSDYVFVQDSNITATLRAGAIVQTNTSTASAAAAGLTVTNLSTLVYPRVLGNWTWPGFQRWTNATEYLQAVCFHCSGQKQRPVRAVRFVASDGTTSVTNWQTRMRIDRPMGDAVPFAEYIGAMNNAALATGAVIRCDFTAWPWIGDAALDTFDNVNDGVTPYYASITNVCDAPGGAWGGAVAVVSGTNFTTGTVVKEKDFDPANPPAAFTNIAMAEYALAQFNSNTYGRLDLGGSTVYLRETNHHWADNHNCGTLPRTWLQVKPFPGALRSQVVLSNNSTTSVDNNGTLRFKVDGLTVAGQYGIWYNVWGAWFDRCLINFTNAGTTPILYNGTAGTTGNYIATRNDLVFLKIGLRPGGANYAERVSLMRGNTVYYTNTVSVLDCMASTVVGNSGRFGAVDYVAVESGQLPDNVIIYNNRFPWAKADVAQIKIANNPSSPAYLHGAAIVQNLLEVTNSEGCQLFFCSDGTTAHFTNCLIWCNTLAGQRANIAYNDTGTAPAYRVLCADVLNSWDGLATKTDTFNNPTSGARIGNWAFIHGVGSRGSVNAQCGYGSFNKSGTSATYAQGWAGMNGYDSPAQDFAWAQFVDRQSYATTGSTNGNGIYRLQSASPFFRMTDDSPIPYDLDGNPRSAIDPPGAYVSGNVRRGGMF